MAAVRHDPQTEIKSVNKLLEIAEMKHYLQEIEADQSQQFSPHRPIRDAPGRVRYKQNSKHLSVSLQKTPQLRERQVQINWDEPHFHRGEQSGIHFNSMLEDGPIEPISARLPQVSRNSNNGDRILSMSSTFHPGSTVRPSRNQGEFMESYRYIRGNELSAVFTKKQPPSKPKNNVVYLRPNKSETIRELLNQMKVERNNHHIVELNSMLQDGEDSLRGVPVMFSQNQLKELKKYRNFMPFREDQRLLIQKIGEKESVWKRKFKESWQKKKLEQEGRRKNLKPIGKQ